MYLFIDQDGQVTKSETIKSLDWDCWPSVVKIEIVGMAIKTSQLKEDNEWVEVPNDILNT